MQTLHREISALRGDRNKSLMCIVILMLAFYALSEIAVIALTEMWEQGLPNEALFLGLLVAAYFLGFANAREKKASPSKKHTPPAKKVPQTKFAMAPEASKPTAPSWPRRAPGEGVGAALHSDASSEGVQNQEECDAIAKKLIGLKRSEMQEHDARAIAQARQDGIAHNNRCYSTVMGACIRCSNVEMALELFGHMRKHGVPSDDHALNVGVANKFFKLVVENLSEARLRDEGLQLMEIIQACRLMPTNLVQNRLICAWRSKLPDHVLQVFVRMHADGVSLSSTAYRCIMSAYERTEPERTLKLYEEMVERGVKLDRVAFNAALCAYSHLGMTAQALELFEQMPQHALVPNGKTYGTLIRACTAANKVKEAVDLFEAMREEGIEPNRFAYHDAIHCCVKVKRVGRAITLYREMVQKGVPPCDNTYLHLTKACQKRGWSEIADQILADSSRTRKVGGSSAVDVSEASTEFKDAPMDLDDSE